MIMDGMGSELRRLFDASTLPGPAVDPRLSADGSLVAFVCNKEIYVVGTAPSGGVVPAVPRQLTHDARGTAKTNGLADFIAQEELGRFEGLWVSPDGSKIAFEQSNESHIPQYRIMHQGSDVVGTGAQEDHHYPFAGADNPVQMLGVPTLGKT
jgi:dipeptidyl-peptidase-4